MRACAQPVGPASVHHQAVGCDQKHLEEDEQVENVSGQERPHDSHQLKLIERVKMPPARVPARSDGIKQHQRRKDGGDQRHQRGQAVRHQHDTKWCLPMA